MTGTTGRPGARLDASRSRSTAPIAGQIAGAARHRLRLRHIEARAGMAREPAQQRAQIFAAALAEETQQSVELVRRQRRGFGEPRVVAILAGQHRERDAALARDRGQPLDAVAPPVEAADEAHQDHLGVDADALDPEIDRHRMAQVAQMRRAARSAAASRSAAQAAARPARSLSANDSTTTSPGVWPRSTGSTMSSKLVLRGGEEMHRSAQQRAGHAGAVEALEADHDEAALARIRRRARARSY